MKEYMVLRKFISPPREGDASDMMKVTAENAEDAASHAFHNLGKNGSYMTQEGKDIVANG